MKVAGRFHLTYCSNIHAGEAWPDVKAALATALPEIRRHLGVGGAMAVGLRLSARAAHVLAAPAELEAFKAFLDEGGYYVPTINGFPYGAFHGERVKDQVYLPDWRSADRVQYTNQLASILAALLAGQPGVEGTVSTVPGAFKAHMAENTDAAAMAEGFLEHAAHLARLRRETGVSIALAIEPEPACFIETVAEAVEFFTHHLFDAPAVMAASKASGVPLTVEDVRRHVGVCFDACHMAVEFEEPAAALASLRDAGIRVPKVQVSSALRVPAPVPGSPGRAALAGFAEDTYLHQVVRQAGGELVRYTDLPEALADPAAADCGGGCEWRVHFHVPIFLAAMRDLETTQDYLGSVLDLLKDHAESPCLEVETYTWDVLPAEYRNVDVHSAIARELDWVRKRIES